MLTKTLPRTLLSLSVAALLAQAEAAHAINQCVAYYGSEATQARSNSDIKRLRDKYRALEQDIYWKSYREDRLDVSQLIHQKFQEKNEAKGARKKNFELFGIENYRAFVEAREYLNQIPEGELHLTPELIKQTHLRSASQVYKEMPWYQRMLGARGEAGGYKKRNNRGGDPMVNPLTEEQYRAVKANPYTQFKELPWPFSRENKRRGYIIYGEHRNVEKDIQDLSNWANEQLLKIRNGEADAIEVASEFQWRYVSIHPMTDGNGRTSMLLANRILEEADLPPILMTFSGYDIYYSPNVWAEKVRESVFEFEKIIEEPGFKASIEKQVPHLYMSNFADGPRIGLTPASTRKAPQKGALTEMNGKIGKRWSLIKRELYAASDKQEMSIGHRRFIPMMDGFFYDNNGVAHAIHSKIVDGVKQYALYPISDSTAVLYSMGGQPSTDKRFFHRGMNSFMRDHFREFFGFMKAYENSKEIGGDVEVVDYSSIEKANREGRYFLHEWQRPLMKAALEIKDTSDPLKVLAASRGYHTLFEQAVHYGYKTNLHEILAQYTMMDLRYSHFESFAKSQNMNEEIQIIRDGRKKLFDAAKTLLGDKTMELEKALNETPERFPSSQEWKFFLAYYKESPLKYARFEDFAASKDANSIVLLRSDQGFSRYVGFYANVLLPQILSKVPFNQTLKGYVNKIQLALSAETRTAEQEEFLAKSAVYKLLKSSVPDLPRMIRNLDRLLQTSKYDTRGMSREFERVFVEHYLHSVNDPFKAGISFSSNTAIYLRTKKAPLKDASEQTDDADQKEIIPFTFDAKGARVYFARFNRDQVKINETTGYFRQYEIIKASTVASPLSIVDSFSSEFFAADGVTTTDKAKLKEQTDFESKFVSVDTAHSNH